jgi:hypothetical protein
MLHAPLPQLALIVCTSNGSRDLRVSPHVCDNAAGTPPQPPRWPRRCSCRRRRRRCRPPPLPAAIPVVPPRPPSIQRCAAALPLGCCDTGNRRQCQRRRCATSAASAIACRRCLRAVRLSPTLHVRLPPLPLRVCRRRAHGRCSSYAAVTFTAACSRDSPSRGAGATRIQRAESRA